jgi:hypothetical protein
VRFVHIRRSGFLAAHAACTWRLKLASLGVGGHRRVTHDDQGVVNNGNFGGELRSRRLLEVVVSENL